MDELLNFGNNDKHCEPDGPRWMFVLINNVWPALYSDAIRTTCTAHIFFSEHLRTHCQWLHHTFLRFAQNLIYSLFLSQTHCEIATHHTQLKIKGHEKSVLLSILTPKICQYYHLALHWTTTIAVQMAVFWILLHILICRLYGFVCYLFSMWILKSIGSIVFRVQFSWHCYSAP